MAPGGVEGMYTNKEQGWVWFVVGGHGWTWVGVGGCG